MHDAWQRQLSALLAATVVVVIVSRAFAEAPSRSRALQELQAARLLEGSILAHGITDEDKAKLRRTFAQLEAKYPKDATVKNAFAEFLWETSERDSAFRKWQAAERLDPQNATVLSHLGGAHLAAGEVRKAIDYLARATVAAPKNAEYHFDLANAAFIFRHALARGEDEAFDLALQHFAEASKLEPERAEYAQAYAECFYGMPKPDWRVALAAWRHFHEITTKKDFALANIARVHMKLGEKDEARACLAQIRGAEFNRLKTRLNDRIDTE